MIFNTTTLYDFPATATVNSSTVTMLQTNNLSIQVTYTITTGDFTIGLAESNDGVNYAIVGTPVQVTASGTTFLKIVGAPSLYYRAVATRATGTIDRLLVIAHQKGV